ncbi:MAG: PDZ domain-containing protein [Planctomycetes bacterium]|nr:PDZ domain-containing protein [Planctomycetota bacterium]
MRLVQANNLDLAAFQFDYGLTWAVLFMNADKTVYGRYGTRSQLNSSSDVTDAGFRKAALAALEIHRGYPDNKAALEGKRGAEPKVRVPQDYPTLRHFAAAVNPAVGERNNSTCIHCHDIQGAEFAAHRQARKPIPDETLWSYPMPDTLGLRLDPEERATVQSVTPGSAADLAGFRAGDEVVSLEGQQLVSVADVQWVLQGAKDGATLAAKVKRGRRVESLSLILPAGWRRSGDLSWRQGTWVFFRPDLQADPLSGEDRKKLKLAEGAVALRVRRLGTVLEDAGFRVGDVIVAVAGRRKGIDTFSQLLAFVAQNTLSGEKLELVVLRGEKEERLALTLP